MNALADSQPSRPESTVNPRLESVYTKGTLPLPQFSPVNLTRFPDAFDHPDFVFELKMDGFRALAHIDANETRLVSRKGNTYKSFAGLCAAIHAELRHAAVLDGEVVRLDASGRPQFYKLLRHRGEPLFYAFDVLWFDGEDLRSRPMIDRKRIPRSIVPEASSAMLYAWHLEREGKEFYRLACEHDLEGIVAKLEHGAYGQRWFKIRNPRYSQYEGRRALFEKKRAVGAH